MYKIFLVSPMKIYASSEGLLCVESLFIKAILRAYNISTAKLSVGVVSSWNLWSCLLTMNTNAKFMLWTLIV